MSVATGAAFLDRSVHGHCGITGSSEGDCEIGLNGAFGLEAADVQGGWKGAAAACVARCQGCARCRFVTVSLQYKDCSWYHACDLASIKPEKLFRTGRVEGTQAQQLATQKKRRVALVFFGKFANINGDGHATTRGRSQNMKPHERASGKLIELAHGSWATRLLQANPDCAFDVFAHTWSPEAVDQFNSLWGDAIKRQHHEPTRYLKSLVNGSAKYLHKALAFRCQVPATGCERTISMLLSVEKALALRREHELQSGASYDVVVVARHDLALVRPLLLPAELSAAAASDDVVFPFQCPGRGCGRSQQDAGCSVGGRHCRVDYSGEPYQQATYMVSDWLFVGQPNAVDRMSDALRHLHGYALGLSRFSPYLAAHAVWPWHALQPRTHLRLRWGLVMAERDLLLARHATAALRSRSSSSGSGNGAPASAASSARGGDRSGNGNGNGNGRGSRSAAKAPLNATPDAISAAECWFARDGTPPPALPYDRPAVLDSMCPYSQFYRCDCKGASSRSTSEVRRLPLDAVPALV
tara:strand:+ start:741 stop:2318 length:1578 start_codon:yes stop_codon:yes gene_type:complete